MPELRFIEDDRRSLVNITDPSIPPGLECEIWCYEVFTDENGEFQVTTTGGQGSHVLSSMSAANCYIVLPEDTTEALPGDTVTVLPFSAEL